MCIILIVLGNCHYFVSNGKCIWFLIHTVMYKRSCECHCVVSNCKFVRYILHIVMFNCHSSMYDSTFVRCSFYALKEQMCLTERSFFFLFNSINFFSYKTTGPIWTNFCWCIPGDLSQEVFVKFRFVEKCGPGRVRLFVNVSYQTTWPVWTQFGRNIPWVTLPKSWLWTFDWLKNVSMAWQGLFHFEYLTIYQTTTFWTWPNWKHLQTTKNVAQMMITDFDNVCFNKTYTYKEYFDGKLSY